MLPAWVGQRSPVLEKQIKHQCRKRLSPKVSIGDQKCWEQRLKMVVSVYFCRTAMANMFFFNQKRPPLFLELCRILFTSGDVGEPSESWAAILWLKMHHFWKNVESEGMILNNSDHPFIHHRALFRCAKSSEKQFWLQRQQNSLDCSSASKAEH